MGDYRVIAGVSATLRNLLTGYMKMDYLQTDADVTLVAPDVEPEEASDRRVNLFLWRVTENEYLENREPSGPPGAPKPPVAPLALDLHYLLTVHSAEDGDETAQQLLGDAMGVLHDYPVLTDKLPRRPDSRGRHDPPESVLDRRIRPDYDHVRVTLDPMDPERLVSLWNSFTVPYRLSAAYRASVVEIESRREVRTPGLVGEPSETLPPEEPPEGGPWLHVGPFDSPQVRSVRVIRHDDPQERERPYPFARIGDRVVLYGENLWSEETDVEVDGINVTPGVDGSEVRLEFVVPDDIVPHGTASGGRTIPAEDRLQPGARPVRVHREVFGRDYGDGEPYRIASNTSILVLVPSVQSVVVSGDMLEIRGLRLVNADLKSVVMIGDHVVHVDRTPGQAGPSPETSLEVALPSGLVAGREYPVRVRVNGAESVDRRTVTAP